MICTHKQCFSSETIGRLALYLQNFKRLRKDGIEVVSSSQIAKYLNVSPEQFRKDLSYFGEFGKRGVGYNVEHLVNELELILGLDKSWNVALVGAGRLGCALLNYQGFSELNVWITAAFDGDPEKVGRKINDILIQDLSKFKVVAKKENIKICVISVPVDHAQNVADLAVESGIKAILNFAPVLLNVPKGIQVTNIDFYCEIERLIYFLNN